MLELYPMPDVVHREFKLMHLAFTSGHGYPQLVCLGVKNGVPYKQPHHDVYPKGRKHSPVTIMTLARERIVPLVKAPGQQLRVVLLAYEDSRFPDRTFNVVIDGIRGYDQERRWCSATIQAPLYVFGKTASVQTPRLGIWTELYNPVPALFPET